MWRGDIRSSGCEGASWDCTEASGTLVGDPQREVGAEGGAEVGALRDPRLDEELEREMEAKAAPYPGPVSFVVKE